MAAASWSMVAASVVGAMIDILSKWRPFQSVPSARNRSSERNFSLTALVL
jgi:hypothetical protein